jgi:hypothetical protein
MVFELHDYRPMLLLALLVRCALASETWITLASNVGLRLRMGGRFVRSAVLLKFMYRLRWPMLEMLGD